MGGFEERFSKVGRALDDAREKVRDKVSASGEPGGLVDTERARERYAEFKTTAKQKAEQAWETYQGMPKAKAAAYALGALCVALVVAVVVLLNSGPGDAPPSRAKADEIATMAALRAKMSSNTTSTPPKR